MWKNVLFIFGFVLVSNCVGRSIGQRNQRLSLTSHSYPLSLNLSLYLSLSLGAMISQPKQNLAGKLGSTLAQNSG